MGALLVAVVVSWLAGASQPSWFITSAANVRLREAASTTAPIVRELPLGTWLERVATGVIDATGKTSRDDWFRVRTRDGAEGWITAALTRPLDPARPLPAIEDVVRARLPSAARFEGEPRGGGESFASRVQLVRLVEEAPVDPADRGERRAIRALSAPRAPCMRWTPCRSGATSDPPYTAFLEARASAIRYNEPGGNWMLEYDHVRRIHDQHRDTPVADEIAWLLVTNGLAGECEGDLPCAVVVEQSTGQASTCVCSRPAATSRPRTRGSRRRLAATSPTWRVFRTCWPSSCPRAAAASSSRRSIRCAPRCWRPSRCGRQRRWRRWRGTRLCEGRSKVQGCSRTARRGSRRRIAPIGL